MKIHEQLIADLQKEEIPFEFGETVWYFDWDKGSRVPMLYMGKLRAIKLISTITDSMFMRWKHEYLVELSDSHTDIVTQIFKSREEALQRVGGYITAPFLPANEAPPPEVAHLYKKRDVEPG